MTEIKTMPDVSITVAAVIGARMAQRYVMAAVILAMAKSQALDVADVHLFLRTFGDMFATMAKGETDPVMAQAKAIAAEEIAALEPTVMNMLTIPPGAGRA